MCHDIMVKKLILPYYLLIAGGRIVRKRYIVFLIGKPKRERRDFGVSFTLHLGQDRLAERH